MEQQKKPAFSLEPKKDQVVNFEPNKYPQPNLAASREVEELAEDGSPKFIPFPDRELKNGGEIKEWMNGWEQGHKSSQSAIALLQQLSKAKEEEMAELRKLMDAENETSLNLEAEVREYRDFVDLFCAAGDCPLTRDRAETMQRKATLNKYNKEQKDERSVARNDAQS